MVVDIAQHQVAVKRVAEDDLVEQVEAEAGEIDRPAAHLLDLLALAFVDAVAHPAREAGAEMDLAPAEHLDDRVAVLAHGNDLAANFQADLVDHPQDVALGHRRIGPHDEVRPGQDVEGGGVVGDEEGAVKQLAQQLGGAGRIDVVDRVRRLDSRHVMGFGAHTADAAGDDRHLFDRPADGKLLEAAQLRDLEVGALDAAGVVQEDLDLAVPFQAGYRVDRDMGHAILLIYVSQNFAWRAHAPLRVSRSGSMRPYGF